MADTLDIAIARGRRAQRATEARGLPDRVLSIDDTCAMLGISRAAFYADRRWIALRQSVSERRRGVWLSAILTELQHRREHGDATTRRPQRRTRPVVAAPTPDADEAAPRGYQRRRRAGRLV